MQPWVMSWEALPVAQTKHNISLKIINFSEKKLPKDLVVRDFFLIFII